MAIATAVTPTTNSRLAFNVNAKFAAGLRFNVKLSANATWPVSATAVAPIITSHAAAKSGEIHSLTTGPPQNADAPFF